MDCRLWIVDLFPSATLTITTLEELLKGRTIIVIAHRLSTIRKADLLPVLDHGKIVERGKHEELLAAKGFYYDLYMSQFRREQPADTAHLKEVAGGNGHKTGELKTLPAVGD